MITSRMQLIVFFIFFNFIILSSFAYGSTLNVQEHGAIGDGLTNDLNSIQSAIDEANSGDIIFFPYPDSHYKINGQLIIDKSLTVIGQSIDGLKTKIKQYSNRSTSFYITSSNVTIKSLNIEGIGGNLNEKDNDSVGIYASGMKSNFLSNVKIIDCDINKYKMYGIQFHYIKNSTISQNNVKSIRHAGIMLLSCDGISVTNNVVDDIKCFTMEVDGNLNGYGISATNHKNEIVSKNINIESNIVSNVYKWIGLDTHGGLNITFRNNYVFNCDYGIRAGISGSTPPVNCLIIGNVVSNNIVENIGKTHAGIIFHGYSKDSGFQASGKILNNTVSGHGDEDNYNAGGMVIYNTYYLEIKGNEIVNCSPFSINMVKGNGVFEISNNDFIDPWSNTWFRLYGEASAVSLLGENNYGYVGSQCIPGNENKFIRGTKQADYVSKYMISVGDVGGNLLSSQGNIKGKFINEYFDNGERINKYSCN